jgi:hypothetical protein
LLKRLEQRVQVLQEVIEKQAVTSRERDLSSRVQGHGPARLRRRQEQESKRAS